MPFVELLPVPQDDKNLKAYLLGNFRRIADALNTITGNATTFDGVDSIEYLRKGFDGVTQSESGRNTKTLDPSTLNARLVSGWYDGNNVVGAPDANWYLVLVLAHSYGAHWQRQIAFSMTSNGPNGGAASAYSRRCNGGDPTVAGNWSAWVPFSGTDSGWVAPSFINGWGNVDDSWPVAYRKKDGVVYLRGLMARASGTFPSVGFVLPAEFRPSTAQGQIFPVVSGDAFGRVTVAGNGDVVANLGNNVWFALASISFPTDEGI